MDCGCSGTYRTGALVGKYEIVDREVSGKCRELSKFVAVSRENFSVSIRCLILEVHLDDRQDHENITSVGERWVCKVSGIGPQGCRKNPSSSMA
jgi:hypothetical protein